MKKIAILSTTIILTLFFIAGCDGPDDPIDIDYTAVAQCLTDKGVKMYGSYRCGHCNTQKERFGSAVEHITYMECDPRGENADVEACEEAGISSFPTWTFPGQENLVGLRSIEELAKKANCEVFPANDKEIASPGEDEAT